MNLSTLFFVFAFLPVSLILYLVCPRVCKNALLVLISFVFMHGVLRSICCFCCW